MYTKQSQRFDFCLFFYVAAMLIGSAVWLRLIPSGDLSGRGIQSPLWLEEGSRLTSEGCRQLDQSSCQLSPERAGWFHLSRWLLLFGAEIHIRS